MSRSTWIAVCIAAAFIAFGGLIPVCSRAPAPTVSGDAAPPIPADHATFGCERCHPEQGGQ